MLIPDDNHLNISALTVVHEGDRSHIDGISAHAALLHKAPTQDDGEVAVLGEHYSARDGLGSNLNGPLAEVGNAVETVGARSSIFGNESVVECKAAADIDVAVSRLEHHGHILNGTNAALEKTDAELRVELLEGDLVRRDRGDGLVGLASLGSVGRDGVVVGRLGAGKAGSGRLAVAGCGGRLARGRVHDRVSASSSDSACFAVVVGRRDVRCGNAVDANTAALATTRGTVDQGGLVNHGHVGTLVCAVSRVLVSVVAGNFGGFEIDCSIQRKNGIEHFSFRSSNQTGRL